MRPYCGQTAGEGMAKGSGQPIIDRCRTGRIQLRGKWVERIGYWVLDETECWWWRRRGDLLGIVVAGLED